MDLQWFAAEDEGKTEEASEQKLRKARKEGRIAKSQELNGTVVFLFVVAVLILLAPWFYKKICEMMIFYFNNVTAQKIDDARFYYIFLRNLLPIVACRNSCWRHNKFSPEQRFYFYNKNNRAKVFKNCSKIRRVL